MTSTNIYLIDSTSHKLDAAILLQHMQDVDANSLKMITGALAEQLLKNLTAFAENYYREYSLLDGLSTEEQRINEEKMLYLRVLFDEAVCREMKKFKHLDQVDFDKLGLRGFIDQMFDTDEGTSLRYTNNLIIGTSEGCDIYFLTDPKNDQHNVQQIYSEITRGVTLILNAMTEYGVLPVTDFLQSDAIHVRLTGLYTDDNRDRSGLDKILSKKYCGVGLISRLTTVFGQGWMESVAKHPRFNQSRWKGFADPLEYSGLLQDMVDHPHDVVCYYLRASLEILIDEQVKKMQSFATTHAPA